MANVVYTKAKQNLIDGNIDLKDGTVNAVLVTTAYTAVISTDDALDDIPGGARVATATLAGKTITDGVFDATDTVFMSPSPPAGNTVIALVLYMDSGVEATSYLIAYMDTGLGLPVVTNGADLTVEWDNGINKILRVA